MMCPDFCLERGTTAGATRLWSIALDDAVDEQAWQVLAADERWRAARIVVPAIRRRFIRTRAALRRILGHEVGVAARSLVFAYGKYGKPALDGYPQLHFNLSHSGERALLAISTQGEVGIDLEQVRERASVLPLARRFLSEAEAAQVAAADGSAREHAFLRYWTRKEAVLKATGRGIGVDTRPIDVGLEHCASIVRVAHDPREWLLCDLAPGSGWIGALCLAPADTTIATIGTNDAGHADTRLLDRRRAA